MHRWKMVLNWTSALLLIIGGALAVFGWFYGGDEGFGGIENGEHVLPNGIVAAGYLLLLAATVLLWLRVRIPSHIDEAYSQNTPTYSHLGKSRT